MTISVKIIESGEGETRAQVFFGNQPPFELYVRASTTLSKLGDCWASIVLPVAMKLHQDIYVDGALSAEFVLSLDAIQDELLKGHPDFAKVAICAKSITRDSWKSKRTNRSKALFYSGGLDSTYSALTQGPELELIAVHGFDIYVHDRRHWSLTLDLLRKFSAHQKMKLVVVETNVRSFSDIYTSWGQDYFGSALAAIGMSLAEKYHEVLVSSGVPEKYTKWGAFQSLFKAYSNPSIKFTDDGIEPRTFKAHVVSDLGYAEYVRVCWKNLESRLNCGSCPKCIRTRFEFESGGNGAFPPGLDTPFSNLGLVKQPLSKIDAVILREDSRWLDMNHTPAPRGFRVSMFAARTLGVLKELPRKYAPKFLKTIYKLSAKKN